MLNLSNINLSKKVQHKIAINKGIPTDLLKPFDETSISRIRLRIALIKNTYFSLKECCMAIANDTIEIAKLQKEIEAYLNLGSTSVIFEFEEPNNKTRLNLITVNPRHNQSFLFQSIEGYDKKDCLEKMLLYVKTSRDKENSYTIQWSVKGVNELHTSYFRSKDIPEALDKLFFGRDPNALTIFSVVLNPIS